MRSACQRPRVEGKGSTRERLTGGPGVGVFVSLLPVRDVGRHGRVGGGSEKGVGRTSSGDDCSKGSSRRRGTTEGVHQRGRRERGAGGDGFSPTTPSSWLGQSSRARQTCERQQRTRRVCNGGRWSRGVGSATWASGLGAGECDVGVSKGGCGVVGERRVPCTLPLECVRVERGRRLRGVVGVTDWTRWAERAGGMTGGPAGHAPLGEAGLGQAAQTGQR